MVTYLLLRNNKESGPLKLEELIQKGLKPYDLIWVNGKSAAWRYPSEIPELQPYTPVPDEQKIERPAGISQEKKQQQTDDTGHRPQEITTNINNSQQQNSSLSQKQENTQPTSHSGHIFVSLPNNETGMPHQGQAPATPAPVSLNVQNNNPTYYNFQDENSTTDPPVALEEKFSQPLDEIKEMYVQTLQQRKKKLANKNRLQQGLKVAAVILVILSMGMLIGMYYETDETEQASNEQPLQAPVNNPGEFTTTQFISSIPTNDIAIEEPGPNPNITDETYRPTVSEKNTAGNEPGKKNVNSPDETYAYTGAVTDSQTKERKRVTRNDDAEAALPNRKPASKSGIENIWNDVSVTASDFKTGPFGGVRDLQLTIANKSSFPIDKVEVEIKYIGMEKQVVKTQTMVFNDIDPGGKIKADVPRSGRGIDVDVSIQKINVKDFSFARSGK